MDEVEFCRGRSFVNLPRDGGREDSEGLLVGGALAGFRMLSVRGSAERVSGGFTVEFEDDVDDSRTEGKPDRDASALSTARLVLTGLRNVGLGCRNRGVVVLLVANTPGEYEEAELGVGA